MKKSGASQGQPASELISKRIAALEGWRGDSPSARTATRFAGDDLDRAKRGFAADQGLQPAALMYRGIDQLRAGVGFGEGQGSR